MVLTVWAAAGCWSLLCSRTPFESSLWHFDQMSDFHLYATLSGYSGCFYWKLISVGKGKVFLHYEDIYLIKHIMKMFWGSGSRAPCILNHGSRWKWVVSFTSQLLYPWGKSPLFPLDRRLGGPRVSLDAVAKRKNFIIAPDWNWTLIIQPVA
jgi:hypothetical protein